MKWMTKASIIVSVAFTVVTGLGMGMPRVTLAAQDVSKSRLTTIESINTMGEGDAAELVIKLSSPATYTSFKTSSPLRLVVDFSQTTQGAISTPLFINKGNFKSVKVSRFDTDAGALTRLDIELLHDLEAVLSVSPVNPAEIRILFPHVEAKVPVISTSPDPSTSLASANPVPAAPTAAAEPPTEAAKVAEETVQHALTAISVKNNTIILSLDGAVGEFKTFRLNKPERFVVDLVGVKSGLANRLVPLNASGIASARVGIYPDKVRVVLDPINGSFPETRAVKSGSDVIITLDAAPAEENAHTKLVATRSGVAAEKTPVKSDQNVDQKPDQKPAAPPLEKPSVKPEAKQVVRAETKSEPKNELKQEIKPDSKPVTVQPTSVAAAKVSSKDDSKSVRKNGPAAIEMIDFQVVDGISRISVKLNGEVSVDQPVKSPGYITLTLKNSQIPKNLQRSLETQAFITPVLRVTPLVVKTKNGIDTKIRIAMRAAAPYEMRQEGDMLFVDIKNPDGLTADKLAQETTDGKQKAAQKEATSAGSTTDMSSELAQTTESVSVNRGYKGRKVTLEFADAEVRKIFQLLSEVSNKNFVLSDDVTGAISLKLVNVPWDQALDIILDTKGLDKREDGNIILIKGRGKFKSQAEEELEIKKTQLKSEVLITEYFPINYSKTGTMKTQIEGLITANTGKVNEDERTNTLIITAIKSDLDRIRTYLKKMDVPEKQVMIEARIIEATSTFTRNLGVSWGNHYRDGSASFAGINQFDTSFGGLTNAVVTTGQSGSAGGNVGISFGTLASNLQLDMRLNAAASAGLIKIVSTPKIATLNNKTAKITQGQSIPYQNTTSTTGATTQFVQAVLSLEVKPHINANGTIGMEIKCTNNSAGSGSPPPINTKEATTEMLLKDGETTVIGGIFVDSDTEGDDGVPYLMDIPLFGKLFKSTTKSKVKSELLIFITPRILGAT